MKSRIRSALNRELQSVRVGDDLKNRILAEAAGERMTFQRKKLPFLPVAAVAAVLVLAMLTAGVLAARKPRPDRRNQVYSDGGQSWVWVSESDALYHARRDCGGIAEAVRMPLTEAKAEGRTACRVCIPMSQPTASPDSTETPPASDEVTPVPEETGLPQNDMSIVNDEELPVPTEQPEEAYNGMEIGGGESFDDSFDAMQTNETEALFPESLTGSRAISEGEILEQTDNQVWATKSGMYYHWNEHCSGMAGAVQMDEDTAVERGQRACPLCRPVENNTDSDAVWMDEDGMYYHSDEQCQALNGTVQTEVEQAILKYGCHACPRCVAEPTVYATTGGVYYHAAYNCSGMQDAYAMLCSDALLAGKKRCPVCADSNAVYATTGGTYYHCLNECSGMRGALMISEQEAVERGKLSCPVCMPMMIDGISDEVSIRLRAARSGQYLLIESDPVYSVCWIEASDPVPVDVTSKQFKDIEVQMAEYMSDDLLEEFVACLADGTIRGARIVGYHKYVSDVTESAIFGDETSDVLLIDCGRDATMETVTLTVGALVEDWLIMPEGGAVVSNELIELEPLSLLPDEDWAVLTVRQSRGSFDTIEATVGVHGVTGEVRTEIFDQPDEAIHNAQVSLITVADRQFVRVTQPEWEQALALGEELGIDGLEVTADGKPVTLEYSGSDFFSGGSAAYRLVDGPFEPEDIAISFRKHGVSFSIWGAAMTVE